MILEHLFHLSSALLVVTLLRGLAVLAAGTQPASSPPTVPDRARN